MQRSRRPSCSPSGIRPVRHSIPRDAKNNCNVYLRRRSSAQTTSVIKCMQCRVIRSEFCHEITYDIEELGLIPEDPVDQAFSDSSQKWGALLIAGQINDRPLKSEATSYLYWEWRQAALRRNNKQPGEQQSGPEHEKSAMANDQDAIQQNSSLRTQMEAIVYSPLSGYTIHSYISTSYRVFCFFFHFRSIPLVFHLSSKFGG